MMIYGASKSSLYFVIRGKSVDATGYEMGTARGQRLWKARHVNSDFMALMYIEFGRGIRFRVVPSV